MLAGSHLKTRSLLVMSREALTKTNHITWQRYKEIDCRVASYGGWSMASPLVLMLYYP